ncbi:ankyrin repeat and SOCS box protein 10 isoform X1 [Gadus macrocephalus]|uniref:ankyrin repeat and SOCS box protein 10 isoform X1 n=1 Tax=Gadus macrocephalus TaxID=80720 RepID=UPI0028CB84E0|nr:ankyrin repeat and SOCS box protein 10 isoform X1 [Gadus macrocephalus]
MTQNSSFVFSSTALRSLQLDEDMLERHRHQRRVASSQLTGYMLKKEARSRQLLASGTSAPPAVCKDLVTQNALYTGDLEALRELFPKDSRANFIIEPRGGDMRWVASGEGLWSLSYEQELTTPLHITACRGFADCLRLLLQRGADVELAPGGSTALHEACESCQPECAKLLLSHGANANAVSEDGLMPLHVCTLPESLECARQLLQYGAAITGRSVDEEDTPLHVAARHGLPEHADLYLRYGAAVDRRNEEELTPLGAACAHPHEAHELTRYHRVCQLLLAAGARVGPLDRDKRTPLHMACKQANADVVELLLANGAGVNDMDYGGEAPMHNILKVACYKTAHQPERVVQSLLNYGSIRVWPGALPVVLKHCCGSPRTVEVLLNAYSRLKVTDAWVEAVPLEVLKDHQDFYESLFSLARTPRSLQHLARCRVRVYLEGRLLRVVPKLPLPIFIQNYLLLHFTGFVH